MRWVVQSCLTLCDLRSITCQAALPWDFSGRYTGVGCHFLLQGIFAAERFLVFCTGRRILYHWAIREAPIQLYIYKLISMLFQILFPLRLLKNIGQSYLCYIVGSCWLPILNKVLYINLNFLIYSSPSHLSLLVVSFLQPEVCFLSLWVHSFDANIEETDTPGEESEKVNFRVFAALRIFALSYNMK